MSKKGSHKIDLRKIIIAFEIFVMLFEISVTQFSRPASIYAQAMEAQEETVSNEGSQEGSGSEGEPSSEEPGQGDPAEGEGNQQESFEEGTAPQEGQGNGDQGVPQEGRSSGDQGDQGQQGETPAAGGGELTPAQEGQGEAAASEGAAAGETSNQETPKEDAATGASGDGTSSEQGQAPADTASSGASTEQKEASEAASQEASKGKDEAATASSGEKTADATAASSGKSDAATEGSSDKTADAAAASSGKSDAAAEGSSDKSAAASEASSGALKDDSKKDAAAEGASTDKDKEKEKALLEGKELTEEKKKEEPEIMEGELFASETLKISFDDSAEIPEGSEFVVEEVSPEDYEGFIGSAYEAAGLAPEEVAGLKVLNMSIVKDEEEIQPKSEVYIQISADELFGERALYADDVLSVVHINGDEAEALEVSVNSDEEDDDNPLTTSRATSISFGTGSFSPFVIIQHNIERTATVSGEGFEVTATYNNTSGIPAGTEFIVNELDDVSGYAEQCAALMDEETYFLETIRAFDMGFVDRESEDRFQPQGDISVTINLTDNGLIEGAEPGVVKLDGEAVFMEAGLEDQTFSFSTDAMTTYGIAQYAVKKTLTATDGSTYLITVNYDSISGIPEDAVLSVSEITEEFDEYAEKSAGELDEEPEKVEVVRAFDISFRNPDTGEEYQPTKSVSVSIDIFNEDLEERSEDLDIVHIHGDGEDETEFVDSVVNEGVVEFETESFSVFVVVRKVIEQTLTASDGKEYLITVSFDSTAGIPQNAELVVNEIKETDEGYEKYLTEGLEKIDVLQEEVYLAKTFDITLRDPETGEEYQPTKDVKVSIRLLSDDFKKEGKVDVVHFGEETQVMEVERDGQTIEFQTDGFSVYVVINHENGEVVAPRVEFHFIDRYTDAQYTAGIDVTAATTAAPYNFINTHGEYQTTQILANGDSLELINDPANVTLNNIEKFFYGWYIVDKNSDNSAINSTTGKYEGEINFNWPASPKQIKCEKPITISMQDTNGDGKVTVGETLQWTMNGVTGTGTIDRTGTVHVYLAPLYEDFYFVNFHNNPRTATGSASTSLMTRKLVVFGSGTTTSVRIGNVICESPDPQHKIFSGWESDLNGNGNIDNDEYFRTVQHVLDAEGNIANQEVNNTSGNNGYYIDVTKNPGTAAGSYLELYPVFDEARWLYFNRGITGNNASYVGAAYRLTNDNRTTEDTFYYFNDAFFTGDATTISHISRRPGYTFKGWYLFANMNAAGEITNLNAAEDVNVDYLKSDGTRQTTTINTKAILLVNENGVIQNTDTWYVSSDGVISKTNAAGSRKLFEIDGGNLRFYMALNDMTLTARWEEKKGTYRVIIWKQKVTDDKNAATNQKDYDYQIFYTSNEVDCSITPDLTHFSGTYKDASGNSHTVSNLNLTNLTNQQIQPNQQNYPGVTAKDFTGFHYARNDVEETGTPNPDGTTVYNVRYDRDLRAINFYYYSNAPSGADSPYTYTVTTGTSGAQYGIVADKYQQLQYNAQTGIWTAPEYVYQYQVDNTNGIYGLVNGEYVVLSPKYEDIPAYVLTSTLSAGEDYLIVSGNTAGAGYALGHNGTAISLDAVTIMSDNGVQYIASDDVLDTSVWTVSGSYIFENGGFYIRRDNNNNLDISTTNDENTWDWNDNNNRLRMYRSWWTYDYIRYNNNSFSLSTNQNSVVYLYVRDAISQQVGYTYNNNGIPTDYVGNRYSRSESLTGNTIEYTGTRFTRGNSLGGSWKLVTWSGLYGQTFAQNGYKWENVSNRTWREGTTGNSGTEQTFLDAFIQDENPYNLASRNSGTAKVLYHYRQGLDGKYRIANREIAYLSDPYADSFNFTNKFDGFEVNSYSTGNNGFSRNGGRTSVSHGQSQHNLTFPLHVYHTRTKYSLEFDVNYPIGADISFTNGQSQNLLVQDIYYEAPLNAYGSSTNGDVTNWYYGTVDSKNTATNELKAPVHYVFKGWYEDKVGRVPFNFNSSMPAANKIVYAKWESVKYVVQIDPNGGEIDHVDHSKARYQGFGSGSVTIDGQSYTYDFTAIDSSYDKYPLTGAGQYNESFQTYIRSSYGTTLNLYDPARRFIAMTDRVAAEYEAAGGTIYYYVNYQWRDTDGVSGIDKDIRSALYLKADEIDDFYELYKNVVIFSKGTYADLNQGMTLLDKDTWKALYVSPQKYRETNPSEIWTFLGWFKTPINEDGTLGTEESMPYNVNDPVTGKFKLTAHWRLDGGYSIEYVPKYKMDNGDEINGTMAAWRDPDSNNAPILTYADGAKTEIYKAPTGLTKNGVTITDDSVIFRGWALVSRTGTAPDYIYTPLETDAQGKINTYYFPSDDYVINAANAGTDSTIYLQAIYQSKDSSDRRPKVTNLALDANTGYVNNSNSEALPEWEYPGKQAINTADHLDAQSRPTLILFGDIQSSAAVHLYKYATELTKASDGTPLTGAHQFFTHPEGWFLLGFDDAATEGDYIATYPADSVIAITRNDNKTIYGVWEPMVYVTFKNNTDVTANNVTFGLSSTDNEALEVINVCDGMYERHKLSSYNSISLAKGESITLAFPKGAEKSIKISGTNTLGVGKKLIWNSSIDLVENGNTTSYSTIGSPTGSVEYSHTASGAAHSHTLVSGEVNNTKPFEFNETMIENEKALTVTFTSANNDYALLLDDNYPGGGMQEYDYATADIQPENNVHKEQKLPTTSTRIGFAFKGWAYSATATEPDFSASKPSEKPWYITDLNRDNGFFSQGIVDMDGILTRTLYAVWEAKTDAIYVYKTVPEPGNTKQAFTFTAAITGTYKCGRNGGTTYSINKSSSFKLNHGEYLQIVSANNNPTSGSATAYVQSDVKVFYPVSNTDGTTSYVEDTERHAIIRWEQANVDGFSSNGFVNLKISVTEATVQYYDTSVTLSSELEDREIHIGEGNTSVTFDKSQLPQTVNKNSVFWENTDAGGTMVFVNQRQKYDVKVTKTLESNTTAQTIFKYRASYKEPDVTDVSGLPVQGATITLPIFNVTSGGYTILQDIPAGVQLMIEEQTDTYDNYKTYYKVDNGTETEGKIINSNYTDFTVGSNPKDSANKTHEVAFRNVLKSFNVKFKLVDQNGNPTINGMFLLSSELGSLGEHYASSSGSNPGVFYTSNKFWAGTYKLSQSTTSPKYLKLDGEVTLKVTGRDGITCENENVKITGNATDGYVVTVRNWKYAEITLKSGLLDPMIDQRTFIYTGTYKLNVDGVVKTYDLNRKLIETGTSPATVNLTAYSTDDGAVSQTQLPKTFKIPIGATELTIKEDVDQVTVAPETIKTTYDTTVQRRDGDITKASEYKYAAAIADSNDGDYITFYNNKKTVEVRIKKLVETEDDRTGKFAFTATLLNGTKRIKGYPIYDKNNTPTDLLDDEKTNDEGEYGFTLKDYTTYNTEGIIALNIPVGAKLTVKETGVTERTSGNDMTVFGTKTETKLTEDGTVYDGEGKTSYVENERLYTLISAPSTKLTVTFTNGPSGQEIKFIKRDGFGKTVSGDATNGPKFQLFTDAACSTAFTLPDGSSVIGIPDANGVVQLKSTAATPTEKIPYGVYYMKEVQVPANKFYVDGDHPDIYVVLVGKEYLDTTKHPEVWSGVMSTIYALDSTGQTTIRKQTTTFKQWFGEDYEGYAIFLIDSETSKAVITPDISAYGILNISTAKRKVILKKTDGSYNMTGFGSATFKVLRYDLSPVESTDKSGAKTKEFKCGNNNVYFIDDLPYGTYYIHESISGSEYWFTLTVDKNGASQEYGVKVDDRQDTKPDPPTPPATP